MVHSVHYLGIITAIGILHCGYSFSQETGVHHSSCGLKNIVNPGDVFVFGDVKSVTLEPHILSSFRDGSHDSQRKIDSKHPRSSYPYNLFETSKFRHDSLSKDRHETPLEVYPMQSRSLQSGVKSSHNVQSALKARSLYSFSNLEFNAPSDSNSNSRMDTSKIKESQYSSAKIHDNVAPSKLFGILSDYTTTSGDKIPILFSEYLKKANTNKESTAGQSKNMNPLKVSDEKNVNIFSLMNKVYTKKRERRSIQERWVLKRLGMLGSQKEANEEIETGNTCTWKYSGGPHCQSLVVHMVSGDTSKMNCDQEFLRFSGGTVVKYCEDTSVRKMTTHAKKLSVDHYKNAGATGQHFKGYVFCN